MRPGITCFIAVVCVSGVVFGQDTGYRRIRTVQSDGKTVYRYYDSQGNALSGPPRSVNPDAVPLAGSEDMRTISKKLSDSAAALVKRYADLKDRKSRLERMANELKDEMELAVADSRKAVAGIKAAKEERAKAGAMVVVGTAGDPAWERTLGAKLDAQSRADANLKAAVNAGERAKARIEALVTKRKKGKEAWDVLVRDSAAYAQDAKKYAEDRKVVVDEIERQQKK